MNTSFTQPFDTLKTTTAPLLIEVDADSFIQITSSDQLGAFYATSLSLELDVTKDTSLQLAQFLHAHSLELKSYRQLLKETAVEFSYIDDTPGINKQTICFHVVAEATSQPVVVPAEAAVEFVTLEGFLSNLRRTGIPVGLLETASAQLLAERQIIKSYS